MASFVQCAMYDSHSTGPWLQLVWHVRAIRESTVTFNKSLCNLHLGFIYRTDVSQHRQSKLMTVKKHASDYHQRVAVHRHGMIHAPWI